MTPKQRSKVPEKIDTDGQLTDHAAIASLGGAGALAALSMTVHLTGVAFYTTMSTVICSVAGFFGITLPFAAYTTASTVVGFLTGPIGWALLAIAAAAGVVLVGRADFQQTAAAVCQFHMLKVAALKAAGETDAELFEAMGDPLKRQLVGRWRISGRRETIVIALESDGAFSATCFRASGKSGDPAELLWEGQGSWAVRDQKLTIKRTHTWSRIYWSENHRTLYDRRPILEVTPTRVHLADHATLERL